MLRSKVEKIGDRRILKRSVTHLSGCVKYTGPVLGFDTEYVSDPRKRKLLMFQLSHLDRSVAIPAARITPERLVKEAQRLVGSPQGYLTLVSYFSLTDLQWLDTRRGKVKEYAGGSLDVVWDDIPGCTLRIVDALRWFGGMKLADAARNMGRKKLEYPTTQVTAETVKDPVFREYARHDAQLVLDLYQDLRKAFLDLDVDILTYNTPAATAIAVFRRHYVPPGARYFCKPNRPRFAACWSLWGGRAEVFERGQLGKRTVMDISSAYPNAIIQIGEMPIQDSWKRISLRDLRAVRGGFMNVEFEFPPETRYPCLLVPSRKGSMIYPLKGMGWVTTYEVKLAIELGAKVDVIEGWGYDRGTPVLADFMKWGLAEKEKARLAGNEVMMHLAKLCSNSGIGKFGQHREGISTLAVQRLCEESGMLQDDLMDMSAMEKEALAARHGIDLKKISLGTVWMPEWNALTTGKNRETMGRALAAAGGSYGHTDSIWTEHPEHPVFAQGWKNEGTAEAVVARTRFAACWLKKPKIPHHSVWDKKVAEEMLKAFDGIHDEERLYGKSRPLKIKEAWKRHDIPGRWICEGEKGYNHTASTKWDHKRELLDGGQTRPWKTMHDYYLAISETSE